MVLSPKEKCPWRPAWPVVVWKRAALAKRQGDDGRYPFYFAALGEVELRRGEHAEATGHFRAALALARLDLERRFLREKLARCERGDE